MLHSIHLTDKTMEANSQPQAWEEFKKPMFARFLQNSAPKMAPHTPKLSTFPAIFAEKSGH